MFTAVPRVWEKIYSRVSILVEDGTSFGKWSFNRALKAGLARAEYLITNKDVPAAVEARYKFWDFLVLRNLRRMLGMNNIRRATTGAAPNLTRSIIMVPCNWY